MENYRNSNCMPRSGCQSCNRGDMEARRSSSRMPNTMSYMNNRQVTPSVAGNTASLRNASHSQNTSTCRDNLSDKNTSCQNTSPRRESCVQTRPDMDHLSLCDLPLGMGYVPMQRSNKMYDTCLGLKMGTIFPDLCKPFCGNGGACKC